MPSTIRILVDNFINSPEALVKGLWTAYGFSALVEVNDVKILFDTGPDPQVLLHNLELLKIEPDDIDYVVLSHRHSDHTGGLLGFLKGRKRPVMVVAHPQIFEPALANIGRIVDVSMPFTRSQLEEAGARFLLSKEPLEIAKGVVFSGEIPRNWGPSHTGLVYKVSEGRLVEDLVVDDAALYIRTSDGFLALTGCGHAGVENIIEHGTNVMKSRPIGIVGGLHLLGVPIERVRKLVDYIASKDPKVVAPTHCTGPLSHLLLAERIPSAYKMVSVGDTINIS